MVRNGPVAITMNDGRRFEVPDMEFITVSTMSAHVLRRCDDGKLRAVVLPLVTMTSVEPIERSAS